MVEFDTGGARHAFGPVAAGEVAGLIGADGLPDESHPIYLGPTEAIPALARQTRITFARAGVTDPLSLSDYRDHGGMAGLHSAIGMAPDEIVARVTESGLRGRRFPPGSSGARCSTRRPIRNTSSATPMRVTLARSQTAC